MLLKLGDFTICDSNDGKTVYLDPGLPSLERDNDSVPLVGAFKKNIARAATGCSFSVTVGREFASDEESAAFCHRHFRQLANCAGGELHIRDMLGLFSRYRDAILEGYTPTLTGLGLDIVYDFSCGLPYEKFILQHAGRLVTFGGKLIIFQ